MSALVKIAIIAGLGIFAVNQHAADQAELDPQRVDGWCAACAAAGVNPVDNSPSPQPKPGDKCPPCDGTGKVGDGTVFSICLDCGGDGIYGTLEQPTPQPEPEPEPQEVQACSPVQTQYRSSYPTRYRILRRW